MVDVDRLALGEANLIADLHAIFNNWLNRDNVDALINGVYKGLKSLDVAVHLATKTLKLLDASFMIVYLVPKGCIIIGT